LDAASALPGVTDDFTGGYRSASDGQDLRHPGLRGSSMTARIGLGLVGAGRMGSIHARLVVQRVPEARLVGIADVNVDAARRLAASVGDPAVFGSIEELLAAPGLDAVLVATSSSHHLGAIQAAATAGRDILCEKPIALTIADTRAAIEAASASRVRLQVGFMRRWDRDYARAKARLASGELGRPILFKSLQFDSEPPPVAYANPAVSGGIMVDMGIHEFDLARWLMADEVTEVHAFGSTAAYPELAEVGDVDSAVVNLRFAGGASGTVEMARTTTYGEDVRTEVLATAGSIWVGHLPVAHGSWSGGAAGMAVASDAADPAVPRFEAAYAAQTQGFVRAILDDRPVDVPGSEGEAALAIALAADRSMRERRTIAL
jgi:myo-inositol 2-dehydrogenase/D-chiro-inositol 1-dehydrogenase